MLNQATDTDPATQESAPPQPPPTAAVSNTQLQELLLSVTKMAEALASSSSTQQAPTNSATSVQRPERPSIDLGCSKNKWAFFISEWHLYKLRANLQTSSHEEFRACCSVDLRLELPHTSTPSMKTNF